MRALITSFFLYSLCSSLLWGAQFGPYTYTETGGEIEITDYSGSETGLLEIPALINGFPVTKLGDSAFGLSNFNALSIPSSVTHIGQLTFQGCTKLLSLTIPSTVQSIGESAFFENYELKSIVFEDGDVTLGSSVFVRCLGLESVRLGEGMTALSNGMFVNCRELRTIDIPDSATSVGTQTFFGCSSLHTVSLGIGITEISDGMFGSCGSLRSLLIPETITSIGTEAFASCSSLKSIMIPASVDTIKGKAFQSCNSLQAAIFLGDAPTTFLNGDPSFFIPNGVFAFHPNAFKVYFLMGNTGFSIPTWEGYPAEELDATALPPAPWLVANCLPLNSDFTQSLNSHGIDLLTCYAFGLDPLNPAPSAYTNCVNDTGMMSVEFYGASPGVNYAGKMSTNLSDWNVLSFTLSAARPDGRRTMTSTGATAPRAFMRVEAVKSW